MTVTFMPETWADYRRDCGDLWRQHYAELAARKDRMKMKPDEAAYEAAERAGQLHVLVAREAGVMVGYFTTIVRPHLHYADCLVGYEDAYFLTASHRLGRTGYRLIEAWIKAMKARGVQLLYAMCKTVPGLDHRRLFEHFGFALTDYGMSLWIGED